MRFRTGVAVVVLAGVGVAAAVGYGVHDFFNDVHPFFQSDECTATVSGRTVTLNPEQAENAALITAVSVGRGLPAHAATIALATAYQESKLYNLESGDRDSAGLFQQRPSQGWGTRAQVLDPYHATNAFYDALEKVDGYQDMRVTEAAQEVQRSGFPEAYADHEADARVLASALTGNSAHAFSCRLADHPGQESDKLTDSGLTHRADVVRRELDDLFGDPPMGGFAPGGVSTGHMAGSAHYDGRAVDVFVRPVSPENKIRGWAIAQYLVAMADRLSIEHVIFDDRIWTSGSRSGDGWRDYDPPASSGSRLVLEHRDHVHVDVFD
ncbi:hypothetical protein [Nocardioides sp. URHA0032]|uniref:hypothetical protein n=1 Tax=Nocardioides sp. URHA0032 TaxID=1380388 RepID=UPI00048FAB5D|nr:hypothetical protein [Nocardioides sp. URHA0032]